MKIIDIKTSDILKKKTFLQDTEVSASLQVFTDIY